MKKCILLFMYAIVSMVASTVFASGTYTVGTGQTYTTLKAAFDAINNGTINGDIVLQLAANSSETSAGNSAFSLNNSGNVSGANYTSILIYPTADNIIVQGNSNSTLVLTLNGADNVTIDGRKRDLNGIVLNQNIGLSFYGSAGTLTFTNDACSNTIKYCNVKNYGGNNPISFTAGTTVVTGNDNNNISYNNISGGSTSTRYGINVAAGTAGKENDSNIISYNNIFDVLAPGSNGYFIGLGAYNKNWTISNNSFYLTNSLTLTHTNANQVINLVAANNSGHIVENNYIGGNAPQCAGTMILDKSTASALPLDIITINKSVANETKITVRNNTIKNIQIGANATGTVRGIVGTGTYSTDTEVNEINANFISNIDILGSANITGLDIGPAGTGNGYFSVINNVISFITNGTGIIIGINEDSNSNNNKRYIYNNTVYIGGSSNSSNNSIAYNYLRDNATPRNIKNNIFVNVRSNSGTGKNYAVWYNTTAVKADPDYNIYYVSGTNSVLARYNGTAGTDVSSLPILSGKDANSVVVDPVLTISSPSVLTDYRSTISQVTSGGASDYTISKDIQGNTRTTNQKGAFYISSATPTITGTATATAFTTTYGTASTKQDFTVSSSDLTADITATAPAGFEVASDGATFGATATITKNTNGTLSLRLKANAALGGSYNGVTVSLASTGATTKYITTAASGNTVTAAPITITGIGIANKEYDGSTTATITGTPAYSGLVNGESFSVTGTPVASFATATVGNTKGVTVSGYTAPSSNYSITQPAGLTANITAAPVSLNPGAGNSDSATSYTVDQLANSDIVVSSGEFVVDRATVTAQSVTVAPGAKLTLGANTLTTTNGVVLQSSENGSATLTGDNAVTNATVQQYVTAGRNWYVSPSVTAAAYNSLNLGKGGVDGIVEYNEVTGLWDNVTSGTLVAGKGYIQVAGIAQGSTGTVQFTGTTNAGDISVTLSRTADKGKGFNLVGNPYPSYLDWTMAATANSNVLPTVWFRTKKTAGAGGGYGFATVNAATPSNPEIVSNNANTTITKYIPPMQAYWVRLIDSPLSTTYTVTNAMRSHADDSSNKFKAPRTDERQRLRLQLANGIENDETLIYFDQVASNTFDRYDSPKMMNNSAVMPDLYTKAGSERLVINGLNAVSDNLELPLGFTLKNAAAGLKLSVNELSNFGTDTKVYLIDRAKNVQTELTAGTEYIFDITEATSGNESRFALLFRAPNAPNALDSPENINVKVYVNVANQIVIDSPVSSKYAIYNALGQLIENGKTTTQLQTANCQLPTGLFVVKVGNESKRVIIK